MHRSALKLIAVLTLIAGVSVVGYFLGSNARVRLESSDELAWLRHEFRLTEADYARIRRLHEGYLPACEAMCRRINKANRELAELLSSSSNVTDAVTQKLSEVSVLRAECQGNMLRHFFEVSRAMPQDQGRRYLDEMKRMTLGLQSTRETVVSGTNSRANDSR